MSTQGWLHHIIIPSVAFYVTYPETSKACEPVQPAHVGLKAAPLIPLRLPMSP